MRPFKRLASFSLLALLAILVASIMIDQSEAGFFDGIGQMFQQNRKDDNVSPMLANKVASGRALRPKPSMRSKRPGGASGSEQQLIDELKQLSQSEQSRKSPLIRKPAINKLLGANNNNQQRASKSTERAGEIDNRRGEINDDQEHDDDDDDDDDDEHGEKPDSSSRRDSRRAFQSLRSTNWSARERKDRRNEQRAARRRLQPVSEDENDDNHDDADYEPEDDSDHNNDSDDNDDHDRSRTTHASANSLATDNNVNYYSKQPSMSAGGRQQHPIDRSQLKPKLKLRSRPPSDAKTAPLLKAARNSSDPSTISRRKQSSKSNFASKLKASSKFLKKQMNKAYETTQTHVVKPMMETIQELPSKVQSASDTISAHLQLDSRGKLLAVLREIDTDMRFVKSEFSQFSMIWSQTTDKAIAYLGMDNLDNFKCKPEDELDFCDDAYFALVFGHEFMRIMVAWRENSLIALEAYKLYVETIKDDFVERRQKRMKERLARLTGGATIRSNSSTAYENDHEDEGDENDNEDLYEVDDYFLIQLNATRAYFLTRAWFDIEYAILEPQMKMRQMWLIADEQAKNYESEYFRKILVYQEWYEPYLKMFCLQEREISDTLVKSGFGEEQFRDVEKFFDDFKQQTSTNEVQGLDWKIPRELADFLNKIDSFVQYNTFVYSKAFLLELKQAKQRAYSDDNPKLRLKRLCHHEKKQLSFAGDLTKNVGDQLAPELQYDKQRADDDLQEVPDFIDAKSDSDSDDDSDDDGEAAFKYDAKFEDLDELDESGRLRNKLNKKTRAGDNDDDEDDYFRSRLAKNAHLDVHSHDYDSEDEEVAYEDDDY